MSSPLLGSGRGNDFCVISQAGWATAKLQEPGWGYIQGGGEEMILGSQAGGDCYIMTNFACGAILYFSDFFIKGHY